MPSWLFINHNFIFLSDTNLCYFWLFWIIVHPQELLLTTLFEIMETSCCQWLKVAHENTHIAHSFSLLDISPKLPGFVFFHLVFFTNCCLDFYSKFCYVLWFTFSLCCLLSGLPQDKLRHRNLAWNPYNVMFIIQACHFQWFTLSLFLWPSWWTRQCHPHFAGNLVLI